ncbi:hypothetical protein E3N88_09767 [Mikania micrantha]|uniref:Chromo domain-containing protein n=1 Tax=Mikania micrantha TaxID=192012 RepID=A0A5N6PM07_9ASTR|nr:hypothetical protein E3N88_09767 [Mikania micrantha]
MIFKNASAGQINGYGALCRHKPMVTPGSSSCMMIRKCLVDEQAHVPLKDHLLLMVIVRLIEEFQLVKARMKFQDLQKSYADKRRRPIEFEVGDQVLLKISPWKGVIRFRKRGKLSPRFIGPFRIMARVGKVAYRLDLPDELSGIHPTFHVSHLRKCLADDVAYVPLNDIEVEERLNYIEEPVAIVDTKEKQLRNKVIRQVKIQWKHRKEYEATWETEDEMKRLYPHLFEM